jgi:hypothetical protein
LAKVGHLALLLMSVPAVAGAQTANPPAAIVEATADCWRATGPSSVDLAKLQASGWKAGNLKDKGGKAVPTPLRFFSKADSSVMITVLPRGKTPACSVTSRVAATADYRPLMDQLQARLKQLEPGLKGSRAGKNGAAFIGGGRIALIEPTGTQTAPAAMIVVGPSASEKK